MSDIYFLVQNDVVVNVFSWDGDIEKYQAPEGMTVKKRVNDNGWMYSVWNGSKFIDQKPYDSWVMTQDKEGWQAPTPMPNDGKTYEWDEPSLSWKDTSPPSANGSTQVL
jgi:hypothetical protein